MGRIVRTVVAVAVVVAVSYYAPYLGAAFLKAAGVTAVAGSFGAALATAAAATALGLGAAVGMRALGLTPKTSSLVLPKSPRREVHPAGFEPVMSPRHLPWYWRLSQFPEWGRFVLTPAVGDCMAPLLPKERHWLLIDKRAPIRRGDLFVFATSDRPFLFQLRYSGLVKRFYGVNWDRGLFEFEMLNPFEIHVESLDRLDYAWCVRAAGTFAEMWRAKRAIRRDPGAIGERLAP